MSQKISKLHMPLPCFRLPLELLSQAQSGLRLRNRWARQSFEPRGAALGRLVGWSRGGPRFLGLVEQKVAGRKVKGEFGECEELFEILANDIILSIMI